jgi:hypothetical protein
MSAVASTAVDGAADIPIPRLRPAAVDPEDSHVKWQEKLYVAADEVAGNVQASPVIAVNVVVFETEKFPPVTRIVLVDCKNPPLPRIPESTRSPLLFHAGRSPLVNVPVAVCNSAPDWFERAMKLIVEVDGLPVEEENNAASVAGGPVAGTTMPQLLVIDIGASTKNSPELLMHGGEPQAESGFPFVRIIVPAPVPLALKA